MERSGPSSGKKSESKYERYYEINRDTGEAICKIEIINKNSILVEG